MKYHATALTLLQGELQSIAKKKAAEEQAKKEAQAIADKKAMQELKSKDNLMLIHLTPEQESAYRSSLEDPNWGFILP